jgi:predicted regulator of Ras-like GTPase activity (Roadblock/LC7/MglB family)
MFSSRLQQVAGRIEGTVALSLVAKDGIAVESLRLEQGVDLELLTAELMSQVRAVSNQNQELAVGKVRSFAVTTDRYVLMISALTDDYYLLLVLHGSGNTGRARFELRRAVLLFEEDLR